MDKKEIASYKSVKLESETDESIINKSRFIGYAKHTMTEDEAKVFLQMVGSKHPEASCICYAYICGMSGQVQKFFDGHEPVGGMPILDVIKKKKITAMCCAVVRYFGGVKLGVGGLARAFSNVAAKAIDQAVPSEYELSNKYILKVNYTYQGKIDYMLSNSQFIVGESYYNDKINIEIITKSSQEKELVSRVSAITNNNHELTVKEKVYMCW